ncbi:hypothetical protein O0I10_011882 [Lichtheimia ornata]|uniref:Uncharacterized protein n=1 Tax=Lichtheimia ornata TaxID=688661 RepID=A0AAD7UTK5_9FUNG|nr:uncharacterized protein O0I10_011882 [Lichtheimia ornata]KAJ8652484.1 hypothetical protein O0I10_011882 [Lichtheimia ornata]
MVFWFMHRYPITPRLFVQAPHNLSYVQMLYALAKGALSHQIRDEEDTLDKLVDVCHHTGTQFKRIRDAAEADHGNMKRAKAYAYDGIIYTETLIQKDANANKQLKQAYSTFVQTWFIPASSI